MRMVRQTILIHISIGLKNSDDISLVWHALGRAKIEALSERQKNLLNNALERLLRKKTVFEITDAEILGQYEMITEYISPLWQEKVVSEFYKKQKFH